MAKNRSLDRWSMNPSRAVVRVGVGVITARGGFRQSAIGALGDVPIRMQQVQVVIIDSQVKYIFHRRDIGTEEQAWLLADFQITVHPHRVDLWIQNIKVTLVQSHGSGLAEPGVGR